MKKIILSSFICLSLISISHAQRSGQMRTATTIDQDQPLVIIDSIQTDFDNLSSLNPNQIYSVTVLKNSDATVAYGDKGKNGVIIIKTKPNVNLVKLSDLLDQYTIAEQDRSLKVCKDYILVKDPSKLLLDKTSILRVEVVTDMYWKAPTELGPAERIINIVMKAPVTKIIP